METPRPTTDRSATDTSSVRFAEVARRLGAAAHANGLAVPAFRCPPRTAGATRTLRRYPGGTVVSVRLRDRPFGVVVGDMVDGVLAANRVAPADEPRLRAALRASIDGVVVQERVERATVTPIAPDRPAARGGVGPADIGANTGGVFLESVNYHREHEPPSTAPQRPRAPVSDRQHRGDGPAMSRHRDVVCYVSPFAATAWIPAWQAEEHMERERPRWAKLQELDMLSDAQRAVGPPRIEEQQSDNRRV